MSENLKTIWANNTSQFPKDASEQWWEVIAKQYKEKNRRGHDYEFLVEKFKKLETFKQHIKNIQAFIIALFFQYLEYKPKNSEYLEKNLENFYKFSAQAGIDKDSNLFKDVKCLLEASASHSTEEHKTKGAYGDGDLHYFLDLDMSVLGSSEEEYAQYIRNIHSEYSVLDEKSYKSLRKKVLQSFILIPNIFATKEFRDKYEERARKNIQDELNSLK